MKKLLAVLFACVLLAGMGAAGHEEGHELPKDVQADAGNAPNNNSAVMAEGGLSGLLPDQASDNAKKTLNSVDNLLAGIFNLF